MHECPDCGFSHEAPAPAGPDPVVAVAKIEAARDVEVAKITAGVTRDELLLENERLRAELLVRREEPPVAETDITQVTEVDAPEDPGPGPELPSVEEAEPEPDPPAETEPPVQERRSKGWFG